MSGLTKITYKGVKLSGYTPTGTYSPEDIGDFLRRFQLHEGLKLIGQCSQEWIFGQKPATKIIKGIPVADYVLAYIAMRMIESSNDYRKYVMTVPDLLKACDMYWGILDPIEIEPGHNSDSFLLRTTCNQFEYNRPIHNLLPRTFAIYRDLWPRLPKAIPIENVIEKISGLNIEDVLVMGYAFSKRAGKGFFRRYPQNLTTDPRIENVFTQDKQLAFVDWVSIGYPRFREESNESRKKAPSPLYDKYRFNPLVNHPVIKPDRNPVPGQPPVYLLPVARLLLDRVTRGLYFQLSKHFQGPNKKNPFREHFGHVFQEYIGELLRDALGQEAVLAERKYGREKVDSTDWILIKGDRCILIEVKQSGIFLDAKLWGDLEDIKRDLAKTVGKGLEQLWKFEQAIRSGRYKELSDLSRFQKFEHLVITHDRAYLSNSVLRKKARETVSDNGIHVPDDFHWHLISVDEIEDLLGLQDPDIFDVLEAKRIDVTADESDFGDYFDEKFAGRSAENLYLKRIHDEFFDRFM